ncbi:conjugal transfer protein TraD [Agrobacterium tumefaciens]|uniref:conjugal transfer protein TraD n=1 Tax=Agrobacterium tumefaciens TaxID=358 RepID=UPI001EEE7582
MHRTSSTDARKKDTREKIELGGLIVKAGLRYEKRALLLGMLIDAGRHFHHRDRGYSKREVRPHAFRNWRPVHG